MKEKIKPENKPKCAHCDSGYVYTIRNGTRVCRTCGFREEKQHEITA